MMDRKKRLFFWGAVTGLCLMAAACGSVPDAEDGRVCLEQLQYGGVDIVKADVSALSMIRALGARPMTADYSDLYRVLQSKEADAAENSMVNYYNQKFYEPAPYFSEDGHTRLTDSEYEQFRQVCGQIWYSYRDGAYIDLIDRIVAVGYLQNLSEQREEIRDGSSN